MNRLSNDSIIEQIHRAVTRITPNQAEKLWEKPVVRATGGEWYLDGTSSKKHHGRRWLATLTAIAACLMLCMASMLEIRPDAAVYLDVNPSVELKINLFDRVVTADANNEDGRIILDGMKLKHTDVDVALNAILGSMVKHGYLNETNHTVLVSVESRNDRRAEQLKTSLTTQVQQEVDTLISGGKVISQTVQPQNSVAEIAEHYVISQGKAALVQKIITVHPEWKIETLTKLSIGDLADLLDGDDEPDDIDEQNSAEAPDFEESDETEQSTPSRNDDDEQDDDDADFEEADHNDEKDDDDSDMDEED